MKIHDDLMKVREAMVGEDNPLVVEGTENLREKIEEKLDVPVKKYSDFKFLK
ncbi:hypothetical protein K9M79_06105 [Candidatus Woesearchaeota archaeon]|nr:hypothetical protein [Candidatus Woesearchaeota archaeon]